MGTWIERAQAEAAKEVTSKDSDRILVEANS